MHNIHSCLFETLSADMVLRSIGLTEASATAPANTLCSPINRHVACQQGVQSRRHSRSIGGTQKSASLSTPFHLPNLNLTVPVPGHSFHSSNFRCFWLSFQSAFQLPSQYLFSIGLRLYLVLDGHLPPFLDYTLKQSYSQKWQHKQPGTELTGLSPSLVVLSRTLSSTPNHRSHSQNYNSPRTNPGDSVWTFSTSLAATEEITVVFFSSP